jgi:hypothetical protein
MSSSQRPLCPPLQPTASVGVTVMSTHVLYMYVSTQFSCRVGGGGGMVTGKLLCQPCLDACQPRLMVMTAYMTPDVRGLFLSNSFLSQGQATVRTYCY